MKHVEHHRGSGGICKEKNKKWALVGRKIFVATLKKGKIVVMG